ncbi:MAG: hypothetical protein JXA93_05150, partial [Anaerolineae bacterium]|nr:hypothetical protein [Anaerolineae bacterium]
MSEAMQDRHLETLAQADAQERAALGRGPEQRSGELGLENVRAWQERLVGGMLRAISIVGLLVAAAGTYDSYANQEFWTIPFYWGSYGVVVLLTLWRRAPYALCASAIMALVYILGCTDFVQDGRSGSARVFMLVVPFLAGLLLETRRSIAALVLVTLTMAGFGWAFSAGVLSPATVATATVA